MKNDEIRCRILWLYVNPLTAKNGKRPPEGLVKPSLFTIRDRVKILFPDSVVDIIRNEIPKIPKPNHKLSTPFSSKCRGNLFVT